MYLGKKRTGSEHMAHIKKFLNHTAEPLRRLKSLRTGLDKVSVAESKQLLTEYSAPAFFVFHASYTAMEALIRERTSKGRAISDQLREMMEVILPSLERMIILLPELVQEKWQYNAICLIIRKLLHPENTIELRQWGIKLLVLWLQSLQDKAGDASIELLASAIPHFPPKKTPLGLPMDDTLLTTPGNAPTLCERYGQYSTSDPKKDHHDWVSTQVIYPLCCAQNVSIDPAVTLMEFLLTCLTTQVGRLKWTDPSNHLKGFSFLFFQFKLFYLVCLYKNFRSDAGLYSPIPPPIIKLPTDDMVTPPTPPTAKVREEREGVWQKQPSSSKHVSSVSAVIKLDYDTSAPVYQTLRHLILKFVLKWIMPGFHSNRPGSIQPKVASPSPALSPEELTFTPDATDMMREMWLSSRDNINLLFEICHQAFLLPLSHPGVVNKLTELYSSWVQGPNKPLFMLSPPNVINSLPPLTDPLTPPAPSLSVLPWEAISGYSKFDRSDVRAGLQSSLKMFIAHTSQLFLHKSKEGSQLENQVESGRRILKLYQEIAQQWILDGEGWLYLLSVLLHLTLTLLYETLPPPSDRDSTLGGCLADLLLQTLLVSYVRSSMVMVIPDKYWDDLWSVLSSLTQWKEVISQWTDVTRNITHCLARVVYQLDLDDLPLKQLAGDSHRPRTRTAGSATEWSRKKSFSEYRPLPPPTPTVAASSDVPVTKPPNKLPKMSTFELPSTRTIAVPVATTRRASSPAYTASSAPLTRKEFGQTEERQLTILEGEDDDDESLLPSVQSQGNLLPIAEIPVTAAEEQEEQQEEEESVITNVHIISPVPSPPVAIHLETPMGGTKTLVHADDPVDSTSSSRAGLVISNDDVSTDSTSHTSDVGGGRGTPDASVTHRPPLRRSHSENLLTSRAKENKTFDDGGIRSFSPDPKLMSGSSYSNDNNNFNQYIPEHHSDPTSQTTPTQTTPISWSPKDSSSPLFVQAPPDQRPASLSWRSTSPLLYKPHPQAAQGEGSWSPGNVSLVWQRMVRIIADINKIENPVNHALALRCVAETWSKLREIQANLGVSLDNKSTPLLPQYMPPVQLFLPWTVKACSLSHQYQEGRKLAYKLLCDMILQHVNCSKLPHSVLPHFYRLLHIGLQPISEVVNVAVKSGCQLLSYGLPGSSILLHDCLVACSHVLDSKAPDVPRVEAITMLGTMYYLLKQYHNTDLPVPVSGGDTVKGEFLKERLITALFTAAVKEHYRISRCIALYQVGMFVYSELTSSRPSKQTVSGLDILLATLKFTDDTLVLSSIDMLTLVSEVCVPLETHFTEYLPRLLQGLTSSCAHLLSSSQRNTKAIISLMLCLRDWLMALSIKELINKGTIPEGVFQDIFKVMEVAINFEKENVELNDIESPVLVMLAPLDTTPPRSNKRKHEMMNDEVENISIVARSVIAHLMNFLSHFPFLGGAACLSSTVCAYHDSPSLQYLDELSPEIFDSPRVQFFAINGSSVVTFVEIPFESTGFPSNCTTVNYLCRLIVRDVTGKYCWDAGILYGSNDQLSSSANEDSSPIALSLIKASESSESLLSVVTTGGDSERSSLSMPPQDETVDPLIPPSWKTTPTGETDLLHDLLTHIEATSPECVLFPNMALSSPAPSTNEPTRAIETVLQNLLEQQHHDEWAYQLETDTLPCMQCNSMTEPELYPSALPFQYCRLFLSHMGFLSWHKRNTIQLVKKNEQLIRELKHLDTTQAQCRQTYKVAVLYVACGQEDKASILSNTKGSRPFEEFIAGLGWEVEMSTHRGYTGGLTSSYTSGCTMTYTASSSEEVIFHVSTRMPSSGTDIGQKVRHLGNDEVHIIWSEHWRDYRRSIFKTQFADILIIIYPLSNGLYRIQIDKRHSIQFGPLFDGIVVDGTNLASLVRATAINALRVQRSPLCMYRGRYEDRWKYLQTITSRTVDSSFEDFAQSVIHPLQLTGGVTVTSRHSPVKGVLSSSSVGGETSSYSKLPRLSSSQFETRWTLQSFCEATNSSNATGHRRPATEETLLIPVEANSKLNQSVPDNLHEFSSRTSIKQY